jgi:hypothetical protein
VTPDELAGLGFAERLALARDPAAPGELLAALARDAARRRGEAFEDRWAFERQRESVAEEEQIRDAVTAHPNTPPVMLARFASLHPDAFCRNPAAPLLPLESPDFAVHISSTRVGHLCRHPGVPAPVLAAIVANRPSTLAAEEARHHVNYAGEADPATWKAELLTVLHGPYQRPQEAHTRRMLRVLLDQGGAGPRWFAAGLDLGDDARPAPRPYDPSEVNQYLVMLLPDEDDGDPSEDMATLTLCVALMHPDAPDHLLARPKEWPRWHPRLGTALNPKTAALPGVLERLADDGNRYVRAAAREALASAAAI